MRSMGGIFHIFFNIYMILVWRHNCNKPFVSTITNWEFSISIDQYRICIHVTEQIQHEILCVRRIQRKFYYKKFLDEPEIEPTQYSIVLLNIRACTMGIRFYKNSVFTLNKQMNRNSINCLILRINFIIGRANTNVFLQPETSWSMTLNHT